MAVLKRQAWIKGWAVAGRRRLRTIAECDDLILERGDVARDVGNRFLQRFAVDPLGAFVRKPELLQCRADCAVPDTGWQHDNNFLKWLA